MNILVELVQLGFHGFSVAIMIFSFLLLRKLMSQTEEKMLLRKSREVGLFMAMSVIVIGLGMLWRFVDPQVSVRVEIVGAPPEVVADKVSVKAAGRELKPSEKTVPLQERDQISFELTSLWGDMTALKAKNEGLRNRNEGLQNHADNLKKAQIAGATSRMERDTQRGL